MQSRADRIVLAFDVRPRNAVLADNSPSHALGPNVRCFESMQEQLDSMMGMSGMNNIFGYEDSSPGGARPPPGFDLNDSKKNVYRPPPLRAQAAAAAAHRAAQEGSLAPPSRPQRQHQ